MAGFVTYFTIPLYIISRLFSAIYPILILAFVLHYKLWDSIAILQMLMLVVYLSLEFIVFVLFCMIFHVSYLQWHIMPGKRWLQDNGASQISKYVKEYFYPHLMIIPIRNFLIEYHFGRDIGPIIISYLQLELTKENPTLMSLEEFNKQMQQNQE